ncbi:glycosyltransferase [Achromobacter pestifer]|uniref:Glycosyltransferase n=1 Tax=Achromobacter pestifer TaxID=1353889 RepID=A0A7D4DXI2_9BURK|nr:glycosyltransferase [Achromobacter pestifer]QKH35952.1 glycosyltransferase [Achromobacter pestifer]
MSEKKRLLHLGFFCPQAYFDLHDKAEKNHQYAARKLESRIVDGLRQNDVEVETIGLYPARIFPRNRTVLLKAFKGVDAHGQQAQAVGYINMPFLSHMSRTISILSAGWRCLRQKRERPSAILVYSLHTPLVLSAAILSKWFRIPFYIYVPDLPQYMNVGVKRSRLFNFLKRIDTSLVLSLSDRATGIIGITSELVQSRPSWSGKRTAVLEGVAEASDAPDEAQKQHDSETLNKYGLTKGFVFYAGGLAEPYGVGILIEAVKQLGGQVHLVLCGAGSMNAAVRRAASEHPQIHYLGSIPPEDVKALSRSASFLVNARIPGDAYLQYSFPSKLLEYMATGVPVVSSRLPGIPQEYYAHLLVLDDVTAEGLAECLRSNAGVNYGAAQLSAQGAAAFCRQHKTALQQGKKLVRTIFQGSEQQGHP